jgi:hypothetical protein
MTGSHGGSARSGMPPSSPPHEARTVANTIEGAISLIGPGVWHRIEEELAEGGQGTPPA